MNLCDKYAGRDGAGNRIKTLRAGYGFKPNRELVQALCMPRLVKFPLTNSEVKLADFKDRVDAGDLGYEVAGAWGRSAQWAFEQVLEAKVDFRSAGRATASRQVRAQ